MAFMGVDHTRALRPPDGSREAVPHGSNATHGRAGTGLLIGRAHDTDEPARPRDRGVSPPRCGPAPTAGWRGPSGPATALATGVPERAGDYVQRCRRDNPFAILTG